MLRAGGRPAVLLVVAALVGAVLSPAPHAAATVPDPLIGAIRWDAWAPQYSYSGPTLKTDYSYREPTLGWHNSGVPDHAAIVDQEIDWAADHGLDYWSFAWYPQTVGVQQGAIMSAFDDYMASAKHTRMKFTLMLQTAWVSDGRPSDPGSLESHWRSDFVPYFVAKFTDPQYVKVNGNRPLLYWFDTARLDDCDDGFCTRWQQELQYLADRTTAAGLGPPFLVDNTYDANAARAFGLHGVTSYGPAGAQPGWGHLCFSEQAQRDLGNLNPQPGLVTVPALTPLADGRARGHEWWVDQPAYGEWERHTRTVYEWARDNPGRTTTPATILAYAWNELDEGGPGIVPTKQNGTMYLDAIRAVRTGAYPATYDDVLNGDNCRIAYVGAWSRAFPVQGLFNNDEQTTAQPGATAELTWSGTTGFDVTSVHGPDRGYLEIVVDGVPRGTVDLYSPTPGRASFSVGGLAPGTHTLTVVATGARNMASSGSTVGVDSVTAHVVRDTGGDPLPEVTPGRPDNLARHRTYRSSSAWDANQQAEKAFDGWYDTDWQSAQGGGFAGQWLEVDFGADTTFDQVTLTEYDNRTSGFRIEYWDGAAWRTAYTGTTIGDRLPVSFMFPPVHGTRARVYFTSGVHTPIVYEFEVYASPVS